MLLVLPHTGEALEVKDEVGVRVETTEDFYQLKQEQIELRLRSQHLPDVRVGFFNARDEPSGRLRELVLERVASARERLRHRLGEVVGSSRAMLTNHELEQVPTVQRAAGRLLRAALEQMRSLPSAPEHIHQDLIDALRRSHWGTVRAAIRREGEWSNLSYTYHLGYGARRLAVLACGEPVAGFVRTCATMAATSDFDVARDLIEQAERAMQDAYDERLRKIQLTGQTMYGEELRQDIEFWRDCGNESGRGYKQRIVARNEGWFGAEPRVALEAQFRDVLQREWNVVLAGVELLLEADGDE